MPPPVLVKGGRAMKCPLTIIAFAKGETVVRSGLLDCNKEECAWWDKDKGMCFRASETMELRFIRSLLREIRDKIGGQVGNK